MRRDSDKAAWHPELIATTVAGSIPISGPGRSQADPKIADSAACVRNAKKKALNLSDAHFSTSRGKPAPENPCHSLHLRAVGNHALAIQPLATEQGELAP